MTITVYHGSTHRVEHPLVALGRKNLDFGQGFYVTTYREQAIQWAMRQQILRRSQEAWLNVYVLDMEKVSAGNYALKRLDGYNNEWLEFIAASRHGQTPWQGYDLIEGGVANDKVVDAVEAYLAGLADVEHTLNKLAYALPNNQICLLNQELIDTCLTFVDSWRINEQEERG
mgnify:CR=1 FL=1